MSKISKDDFLKEYVENADLKKFLLTKIMATHKECIKYNFVAVVKKERV